MVEPTEFQKRVMKALEMNDGELNYNAITTNGELENLLVMEIENVVESNEQHFLDLAGEDQ